MKFLVTGSAGYIGGTFTFEALKRGHKVLGLDNYINSTPSFTSCLKENFPGRFAFQETSLDSVDDLDLVFKQFKPECVFHFAGLKSVSDSEKNPLQYWGNNFFSSFNIIESMRRNCIKKIVFSSSATVYGDTVKQPVSEDESLSSISTYGSTKIAIESFLKDCAKSNLIDCISLRYFNPVGAHAEKIIYENPLGNPGNLMPRIIRVALKIDEQVNIFGNDYATKDGTGERDFIHVSDLVDGHFKAHEFINTNNGYHAYNLGTGESISVLELISEFQTTNKLKINFNYSERRKGDIEVCFADPTKAHSDLAWKAERNISAMCKDAWDAVKDRDELK